MTRDSSTSGVDRRTFLQRGVASVATLAGVTGSAAAYHQLEDDYRTVVDVVDEGADPNGNESITGVLEDLREDDILVKFPDGRYYMDRKFRFTDFTNVGYVGKGDATLVPADYYDFQGDSHKLFRLGTHYAPGTDLHVENFNVDFRSNNTGVRAFEVSVSDGLAVKRVDFVGQHDSGTHGPGLFRITSSDGSGFVKGFRAPGGSARQSETPGDLDHGGPTGILCNWGHRGSIRFADCVVGPFPDNGLYAAGGDGEIVVDGGHYANSGTASIRLGCPYGKIDGATVTVDRNPFDIPQEGIRLDYGSWHEVQNVTVDTPDPYGEAIRVENDVGGAAIRDSSVSMGDEDYVPIQIQPRTGPTYILDTDIRFDGSENAVSIKGTDAGEVCLTNVSISGDSDGSTMRHAIRVERDDCEFRHLDVDQPGGNKRRGIALMGDNPFLYKCSFTCTQRGITLQGDDAWINDCYAEAYENGRYSVKVYNGVSGTEFKSNEFPDGVVYQ
ncbi:hypothetical protein ACKVMT_07315 [Halobacteriales archaeon Cl-PHB]